MAFSESEKKTLYLITEYHLAAVFYIKDDTLTITFANCISEGILCRLLFSPWLVIRAVVEKLLGWPRQATASNDPIRLRFFPEIGIPPAKDTEKDCDDYQEDASGRS